MRLSLIKVPQRSNGEDRNIALILKDEWGSEIRCLQIELLLAVLDNKLSKQLFPYSILEEVPTYLVSISIKLCLFEVEEHFAIRRQAEVEVLLESNIKALVINLGILPVETWDSINPNLDITSSVELICTHEMALTKVPMEDARM